ncbi:hypothetical protein [Pelagibacterium lentulum]|uniref:Uncharacterized protein n=1 Tax=Pelagibacterium lentulum TaxID=2029865 RepID=A0A916VY00_9HYPH|nr:hypothetical protein [Pelagibacterium lentulum]GGA51427.1 hypothetical protein GCM10011499_21840 [Pelagibacterium lentulum]
MGKKIEFEFDDVTDEIDRAARVAALADHELLSYHARLHSRALAGGEWISLLEDEMERRGLIKRS